MKSVGREVTADLVKAGLSYTAISERLRELYPHIRRGLSWRSVREYCIANGLRTAIPRVIVTDEELDESVARALAKVGKYVGLSMTSMTDRVIRDAGVRVDRKRVAESLKRVKAVTQEIQRQNIIDRDNPIIYDALYFGKILHLDQNEKLGMFGVTYVTALDVYSGKIVAGVTTPRKNNLVVYERIYRTVVAQYGLWDQLRFDQDREFCLSLYIHDQLRKTRDYTWSQSAPCMQSQSKENVTVERIWHEVDDRVTNPVKRAVMEMQSRGRLQLADPVSQFCTSYVLVNVCDVGFQRFIDTWNNHSISGSGLCGGIPNERAARDNRITAIAEYDVPTRVKAAIMYERLGGSVTRDVVVGLDPLADRPDLFQRRREMFVASNSLYDVIFGEVLCGQYGPLLKAISYFISATIMLH